MNQIIELLDLENDMTRNMLSAVTAEDPVNGMYFQFLALHLQEEIMKTFLQMSEPTRQEYVNLISMLTMGETLYEQYV
jgi:hypothetical protein